MPRGPTLTPLLPPTAGAHTDIPSHLLPLPAVDGWYTQNVILRDGQLVNRPGFTNMAPGETTGGERPTGGLFYIDGVVERTVVATLTHWWHFGGSSWDDITGAALTGTADDHTRFAVWPTGTENLLIGVNGHHDVPQKWEGTGTAAILGGLPPKSMDITIAANRVILARPLVGGVDQQYRLVWSNFNDPETWELTSLADLSDTYDPIVGVRALTRTAFGIFKEGSQWIGYSQPGLYPWRFEMQDTKPGPVSTAAIIVKQGRAFYLGRDASLYTFDGSRCEHIGEAVRAWIQAHINWDSIRRSFAVYLGRDRAIYWVFPPATSGDPSYAVSLDLDTNRCFPHILRKAVSCGFDGDVQAILSWDQASGTWDDQTLTWDDFSAQSFPTGLLGGIDGSIHIFGIDPKDDGLAPAAQWRIGPRLPESTPMSFRSRVQSCESYFRLTGSSQPVTLKVLTTDTLATLDLTPPTGLSTTLDIATQPATLKIDTDTAAAGFGEATAEARFLAVEHALTTETNWAWQGGVLRTQVQESD